MFVYTFFVLLIYTCLIFCARYLIPLANPDGLAYTHKIRSRPALNYEEWSRNETLRLHTRPAEWHKNVDKEAKEKNPACFGTNINRNFAYHWQGELIISMHNM